MVLTQLSEQVVLAHEGELQLFVAVVLPARQQHERLGRVGVEVGAYKEWMQQVYGIRWDSGLYRAGELEQYVIVNRQFYKSLYEFAPCGRLQDMIDDLTRKAYHTRSILLLIPSHIENSLQEHQQLIAEIEARNPERAAQIMFSHRMETLRVLVQEMKYCLMKPDYQNETVLKDFFSDEALADRSALIGKVEYWNFIFEHLAGDRTDAAQA